MKEPTLDDEYPITYSIAIADPPTSIDAFRLGALCDSDEICTYDYPKRLLLTFNVECSPADFEKEVADTKKRILKVLEGLQDEH